MMSGVPSAKRVIQQTFQGEIHITSKNELTDSETMQKVNFFYLSLDIPMIPLFKDVKSNP